MGPDTLFLGRQPILNQVQKLVGYELLFRSADSLHANITNEMQASAHVIVNALSHFGIQDVLGRNKGFINVSNEILLSDALELLPKEQVVIELLESIQPTDEVIDRCRELKARGFTLALDDHLYDPSFEPLYKLIDIVKIDLLQPGPMGLKEMVACLRRWPLTLLAEKVETTEQFQMCRQYGFELFQGFYFARPTVIQQRNVNVATVTLMQLLDQVMKEAETAEIEETFKQNPELIYNLLRLVNSVYFGMREKIKALRHAIAILGREHLKRWVMLALYATSDKGTASSPLMEMAAVRGKFMEMLIKMHPPLQRDADYADRAFMTGVLSLIDVLFNVHMEEAINQCNLAEDVRTALLEREGVMGNLLLVAERVEQTRFDDLAYLLQPSRLTPQTLTSAHMEALRWANRFTSAT
ncbi:MAG: putative signal transduction protein containing EAL and modified HD-GYP [Geobacteraceae bacterium]|nr:MAG: putative signal transduction protein containing EAL and modified HD-GYP [Geobacteraceae bacterium]